MKRENELITVGMPVYNGEKYLQEAIATILSQTYTNIELIISDDCSTDNSRTVYEQFAKKDTRIRVYHQKKNIGFLDNFNYVLSKAKGSFFLWAAQDDIHERTILKKLLDLHHDNPDAVLAVSNYKNIFKKRKYSVYPDVPVNNNQNKLQSVLYFLKTNNLSFFYGLHKTMILKKTGGYLRDSRPFFRSSDYLTILKVLLEGKFVYTPEVLFYKRDTGMYTEQFEIIKSLQFSQEAIYRIFRYLLFPLFYFYDLLLGTYFIQRSKFSLFEKTIIEFNLVRNFVERMIGFIANIFKGFLYFLSGIIKKFIRL